MAEEYRDDDNNQQDLFSELIHNASYAGENIKGRRRHMTVTLSFDKVLLFVILCAIVFAVVFSYGVERGIKMHEGQEDEVIVEIPKQQGSVLSVMQAGEKNTETLSLAVPQIVNTENQDVVKQGDEGQVTEVALASQQSVTQSSEVTTDMIWTVQIITYMNKKYAEEEQAKIIQKGYESFVFPSGKYLQICVGKFETKQDAQKVLDRFKKQKDYADAYIRKVERSKIKNL